MVSGRKPVLNNAGVFDDEPNSSQSFWGVYGVHPSQSFPMGTPTCITWDSENANASFIRCPVMNCGTRSGRGCGEPPCPGNTTFELMYQFGTFNSGEIQAWSVASAGATTTFRNGRLKPRLGLRADVASGDKNRQSPNLQSFNPLFPSGIYFNLANPVGPINMIDLHPFST